MDNQSNMVNQVPHVEPNVVPTVEPTAVQNIEPNVVPQSQPVAPNTGNEQSNKKPIIIGCIVALVLIAAGIGVYFAFFKKASGKEVVNGTINKVFETAILATDKIENSLVIDYKQDIVKTTGSVKASIETDNSEMNDALNDLKNASIDYDLRLDLKTLSGSLDLTEKENDKALIEINSYLKDKVLYIKSNKTNDVYYQDLSEAIEWDKIDISKLPDYKSRSLTAVLKKIQGYVKNAIKDEYITQTEGEFIVDGNTIKGLKTTITLNDERENEITKSIIDQILNDDEGLSLYAEYKMVNKDDAKRELESAKEEIGKPRNVYSTNLTKEDKTKKSTDTKINIYTTTRGKFLGFDTLDDSEKKDGVVAVSQNDVTSIKLYVNDNVVLKLNYNEKEKELEWKNDAEDNKNEVIRIKFLKDGINISFESDEIKVYLSFTEKIDKDYIETNLSAELGYTNEGNTIKAKLDYKNNLSKGENINTFNSTISKDLNELSEYEKENIKKELTNALKDSKIYSILSQYTKSNNQESYNEPSIITTDPNCANSYGCVEAGNGYMYCKYMNNGYEYTAFCPKN